MGGAASSKVCERAAEALEIILASGKGDGLGYSIAGGLQKLEHLTVAARQAAVKAARSEAGTASSEACKRAAQALEILLPNGEGDGVCVCNIYLYIQHSYNIYIHVCILYVYNIYVCVCRYVCVYIYVYVYIYIYIYI